MLSREADFGGREALGLRRAELWELTDRLEVLYGARTFGQLMVSAIELIRPFFDADSYSAGFTDPRRRRHLAIVRPTSSQFQAQAEDYRKLASQSPLLHYWQRTGDHDRVLRRSDCCDMGEYRKTALYCEIDRYNNTEKLLGTWLRPGGGRHLEVAMGRGGRTDFGARDVARMTVLRRHVSRAYANVCDLQRLRENAADDLPADVMELQDTSLAAGIDEDVAGRAGGLTAREREVLRWVVEGKTNREIAIILGISWRTVRVHCENVFRKLGVETRTAAAVRAMEMEIRF